MNIKNILVPVDYSESGNSAMDYAVSLAKEYDAELHLVHVYQPVGVYVDGGFAGSALPELPAADVHAQKEILERVSPGQDVKFRRKLIVGTPSEELVQYAKENQADLVVMGTHGRTGLNRLLMGSVAEHVVRHSPCPVITIKQPVEKLQSA